MRMRKLGRRRRPWGLLVLPLVLLGCRADPADETAQVRGDRAFARGDYEEALAEYRLSLLQENPGTSGFVRAGHAYASLGRVDEARTHYDSAVARDSSYADQA
ncbi:MAG: tetratricopeptide repeat protein, partial [Longimicrobiales bacterium]